MLAQISLIGAGLAVACPPPAGWLGDQGGVVDRGEFVTTAMEAGRSTASGGMVTGELAAVTIASATSASPEFAAIALGGPHGRQHGCRH